MKNDIIELNQKEILAISGGKDEGESPWNISAYLRGAASLNITYYLKEAAFATGFFALGWFMHRYRNRVKGIGEPNSYYSSSGEFKKE
jgi:hypothetical protein